MRDRLSFNTMTSKNATLRECVDACVRHGVGWIAPWRDRVAEAGLQESARMIRDAGLGVSSLCRGGFFPASTPAERAARIDDNRRAIDEAAEGIAAVAGYARDRRVKLGVEPLHPMFAADRSVIVTLGEALDLAEKTDTGVVIDAFHVWWDPRVYLEIARAAGRIVGFHVSDWAVPLPGIVTGRSMMGDGVIELRRIRQAIDAAGYAGPIEVEIFNEKIWAQPIDDTMDRVLERYRECV